MMIAMIVASPLQLAAAESVRLRLHALATQYDFQLEGAELIGNEPQVVEKPGSLDEQIGRILENYNYIVMRNAKGRIKNLTIVGVKTIPATSTNPANSVETEKIGAEHYVDAVLIGPNRYPITLKAMIDTGASTIVLPHTMVRTLGFQENSLQRVRMQTANGTTDGLLATLRSVRVGGAESKDVSVTFVDDQQLGGELVPLYWTVWQRC
jgi:aspartyl protease family protein